MSPRPDSVPLDRSLHRGTEKTAVPTGGKPPQLAVMQSEAEALAELTLLRTELIDLLAPIGVTMAELDIAVVYIASQLNGGRTPTEQDIVHRIISSRPAPPRHLGVTDPRGYHGTKAMTAGPAALHEMGLLPDFTTGDILSMALDFVPWVGGVKAYFEAASGHDYVAGKELAAWERALGVGLQAAPQIKRYWGVARFVIRHGAALGKRAGMKVVIPLLFLAAKSGKSPAESLKFFKHSMEVDEMALVTAKAEAEAVREAGGRLHPSSVQLSVTRPLGAAFSPSEIAGFEKKASARGASRGTTHTPTPPPRAPSTPDPPKALALGGSSARAAARSPGAGGRAPEPRPGRDPTNRTSMRELAERGTTADIIAVLGDPRTFRVYQDARRGLKDEQKIMDHLAEAIARQALDNKGVAYVDGRLSDALWALPGHMRGTLIEHALARSQYRGWRHVGREERGYFPRIDFRRDAGRIEKWLSLKTIDPLAKTFDERIEDLVQHVVDLSEAIAKARATVGKELKVPGEPPTVYFPKPMTAVIEVRVPRGHPGPKRMLQGGLSDAVPPALRPYVTVVVEEF